MDDYLFLKLFFSIANKSLCNETVFFILNILEMGRRISEINNHN